MPYYNDPIRYFRELELHDQLPRLLCEGDSWFSIPDLANIPSQLNARFDLSMLSLAKPGDTLKDVTGKYQYGVLDQLIRTERLGQKWDAILFSLGGDDVIGPGCRYYLRPAQGDDPNQYIDEEKLNEIVQQIRHRIEMLIALRNQSEINAQTPILYGTYTYLTPRKAAHQILAWKVQGPWVLPQLEHVRIYDCALQQKIIKLLLDKFFTLLTELSEQYENFHVIDTRTAIEPVACAGRNTMQKWWGDEIHPSSRGFGKIAQVWIENLRMLRII